jgi:hypothetical protein
MELRCPLRAHKELRKRKKSQFKKKNPRKLSLRKNDIKS